MRNPKIVVIGAGSASFGLTNLGAIMRTKGLEGATLALCDLNEEGLEQIRLLAERINKEWGSNMKIEASTDRTELLPNADFVVISIAIDREKCWIADHELGQKYGIMHYAENGGPGGFFHAARNVALLMPVLKDIERLAPNALVLNFTNPMTRICTAAARYTKVNMVGICHQLNFGYVMAGRILGKEMGFDINNDYLFRWGHGKDEKAIAELAHERFDIFAAGINHFTWILSIKDKNTGEELFPLFKKLFLAQNEFEPYTRDIISIFDECPTSGDAHCLEYLPYTSNMNRGTWQKYDIQMYPLYGQDEKRDKMWHDIAEMAKGNKSIDYMKEVHTERAEIIIESVWAGKNSYDMAVNIPNTEGYISNMDRDAIVEVPAILGNHGIKGIAVGDLPPVVASFCNRQKDIVDLAIKAMVEGDRKVALQALALDPMIDDPDVASGILKDGLEIFKNYLPQFN
jgi:alpha-galactosidase